MENGVYGLQHAGKRVLSKRSGVQVGCIYGAMVMTVVFLPCPYIPHEVGASVEVLGSLDA